MADKDTFLSQSFRDQISSAISKMESLGSEYSDVLDTVNSKSKSFSISNWSDAVQAKLEDQVDNFRLSVGAVDSDIRSGNFLILKSKLNELLEEAIALNNNNDTYKRRSNTLANAVDDGYSDAQISKIESSVNSASMLMQNNVDTIKVLMSEISSIEFNAPFVEQQKPNPVIEPIDAEDYGEPEGVIDEVIIEDLDADDFQMLPQTQKTSSDQPKTPGPLESLYQMSDSLTDGGFLNAMPVGFKINAEMGGVPGTIIYKVGPDAYTISQPIGNNYVNTSYVGALDASAGVTYLDRSSVQSYETDIGNTYKYTWDTYAGKMQHDYY